LKGTKHDIHRATKNRTRNSDAEKLDDIQQHLTQQLLYFEREKPLYNSLFSTKNHLRVPDLTMFQKEKLIVIELDGGIHGSLEMQTDKTKKRNADYNRANIIYILLNEQQAKEEHLELENLATYRVREVLCKLEAKELE